MAHLQQKGDIKFTSNAIWIFASCNAGNAQNEVNEKPIKDNNIARLTALKLGIRTIGAVGFVSEINIDGKGTGEFLADEYKGVKYNNMQFVMFVPIKTKITTTKESATIFGFVFPWSEQTKTTEVKTTIKEVPLGNTIKLEDYVPKR